MLLCRLPFLFSRLLRGTYERVDSLLCRLKVGVPPSGDAFRDSSLVRFHAHAPHLLLEVMERHELLTVMYVCALQYLYQLSLLVEFSARLSRGHA